MSQQPPVIGIDFGTCNSSMAWFNPKTGQAEVLRNAEGEEQTRSLVYFGNGEELVGTPAEHMLDDEEARALVYPPGAKRNIAKKMILVLGGRDVTPFDVPVALLRKLKRDAEEFHFRTEVSRAVITVPATFDQIERERLREAGTCAGFREVELLDEPVAAALAYIHDGMQVGRRVLVYDLGAGTFDLAVLAHEGDQETPYLVLPPCGLRKGGDDFDRLLYAHVDQLAKKESRSVSKTGAMNLEFLRQCCVRKENLSFRNEAEFSSILPDGRPFKHKLDRGRFETLISGIVAETVGQTEAVLQEAKRQGHDIDTVILIGGSSRVPLVTTMLQAKLPVRPQKWQHQDVAVALGAAYHAQTLWGANSTIPSHQKQAVVTRPESVSGSANVPVERSSTPASAPFRFRSGEEARDLPELVSLCDRNWDDGGWHLMEGHFEPWLVGAGHDELAECARIARHRYSHPHDALRFWLRRCRPGGEQITPNPQHCSATVASAAPQSRAPILGRGESEKTTASPSQNRGTTPPSSPRKDPLGEAIAGAFAGIILGLILGAGGAELAEQTKAKQGWGNAIHVIASIAASLGASGTAFVCGVIGAIWGWVGIDKEK